MQLPMLPTRHDAPPACYGRDWEGNNPECAGGADPKYTNTRTGTHVRERCIFFQSCGAKVVQAQQVARPPTQLPIMRPLVPQMPQPTSNFQQFVEAASARYAAEQAAKQRPMAPAMTQQMQQVPGQQQMFPMMQQAMSYPAQTYALNYMMPGYLSVPEQRQEGETIWHMLAREVLRSLFKSAGHTVSHFFDANPLRLPPPKG